MKYLKIFLLSLGTISLVTGCKDPNFGDPQPSAQFNYARVLYINASPDAGSLPILVNNAAAATLDAATASSYVNTVASSEQFRISKVKYGVVKPDTVPAKTDLTSYVKLVGGTSYTYIVVDTLNRPFTKGSNFPKDQGGLNLVALTDVLTAPSSGNAGIRVFNLAPGAPAVYITDDDDEPITGFTDSRAYKVTSNSKFGNVPSGSHTFEFHTGSSEGTTIASVTVTLEEGKLYTVYLSGKVVKGVVKVPYAANVVPQI